MIQYIHKSEINVTSVYNIRLLRQTEQLEQSIRTFGIYKPLILYSKKDKILIDGHARYQCSDDNAIIPVLIEDDIKTSFLKSLHINMLDNPYSEIEKAFLINIALDTVRMNKTECIDQILPALKMKKKMETVNDALAISGMNPELLLYLKQKKAPLQFAVTLSLLSVNNQGFLLKLAERDNMSLSQLRKINDLIFYIQKREGKDYSDIVDLSVLKENLEPFLFEMRYPQYSEILNQIHEVLSGYRGQLSIKEDLESDEFIFSGKIKTEEDIDALIGVLERIRTDARVFKLLRELNNV